MAKLGHTDIFGNLNIARDLVLSGVLSSGAITSSGIITGTRLISTIATGTAPLAVSSTTRVDNLNVQFLSGVGGSTLGTGFTIFGGTTSKTLTVDKNLTLSGTDASTLYLNKDLTVNTNNFTLVASGAARTLTLNRSFTLASNGDRTLTVNDGDKTLAGAGTSLTINNNLSISGTTGSIALGSGTGALTVGNPTQYGIAYGSSATAYGFTAAPTTTGTVLLANTSGAPTWTTGTLTLNKNLTVSNNYNMTLTASGADRTLTLTGNPSIGALTLAPASAGFTIAGGTTSKTLASYVGFTVGHTVDYTGDVLIRSDGASARTIILTGSPTIGALTLATASTGFTIAGGTTSKTLTVDKNLTLSGTDASTLYLNKDLTVNTGNVTLTAQSGGSSVTLPSSGTLITSTWTGSSTLNTLSSSTSLGTGVQTWQIQSSTDDLRFISGSSSQVTQATLGTSGLTLAGDLVVGGSLTINGTTTTLNTATLSVEDINIELGKVTSPSNATANGGGITLLGTTDKTIIWDSTNSNWTSSEHWNIANTKTYKINNTSVLSSTTLGSGITASSLTSVGTIGTGVWQGTQVGPVYGGTGQTAYASGDILYADATNSLARRAKGTDGQVLKLVSGFPSWAADTDTNTATHADGIMKGANSGTQVSYDPYTTNEATSTSPRLYTHATVPTGTSRLNLAGYFWASRLHSLGIYGGDTASGNLTIGSTSNATKGKITLDSETAIAGNVRIKYNGDTTYGNIHIGENGVSSGIQIGDGGATFRLYRSTDNTKAHITRGGSDTTGITILADGKVGIGQATPISMLDIIGTGTDSNPLVNLNITNSSTFVHAANIIAPNLTTNQNIIIPIGRGTSTKNAGYIGYRYSGTAGSNNNVLTLGHWGSDNLVNIDGTGKVGIGTTTPNELLEVVGNIHLSGADRTIFNRSNNSLAFGTHNALRWTITNTGILESSGAQTLRTSTGNLTLGTGGGNGNILLSPNGIGVIEATSATTTGSGFTISANSLTGGSALVVQSTNGATMTGSLLNVIGNGAITSGDLAKFSSTGYAGSTTSGMVDIISSSTARVNGSSLLYISSSGAISGTLGLIGETISVTNTGSTSTFSKTALDLVVSGSAAANTGLRISSSGGTDNIALSVTAGRTQLAGTVTIKTTTPEIKLEAGSTTDSGTMRYNSTTKSIEFIFA